MDDTKADPQATVSELDELDTQTTRGFLHAHTLQSESFANLFQVASTAYSLVDLLIEKGILGIDEVQQQMRKVQDGLAGGEFGRGLKLGACADERNKYEHPETVAIDCAARLPLCRGACCSLDVALSRQDMEEGLLRWDFGRPYYLRRGTDGYCCHLVKGTGCGVYDNRPITCRTYSCAQDARIWKDFEARIPNSASIDELVGRKGLVKLSRAEPQSTVPKSQLDTTPTLEGPDRP
jgi:Fe-S-cluster containining protein